MTHTQTVQNLYAAFQRGDMPAILGACAPDIRWNHQSLSSAECPWNGDFSGRDRVPGFFQALADSLEFELFEARRFVEAGNQVAVLLRIESRVRKNDRPLRNDGVHVWEFNSAGQVQSYQQFNDTGAELAAWRA